MQKNTHASSVHLNSEENILDDFEEEDEGQNIHQRYLDENDASANHSNSHLHQN